MTLPSSANVLDFNLEELRIKLKGFQIEPYRADQIFEWIYRKGVYDFEKMSNLPAPARKKLKENFLILIPEVTEALYSHEKDSVKHLLKLADGNLIETVVMTADNRRTVCVSSQVGCKFHCAFCASGQGGFIRNLSAGEIVGQLLRARDEFPDKKISHCVFMGIGEPFDNYRELLKAIRVLNAKEGFELGARKMTISTAGVSSKIEALISENIQVELSVSVHGPNDVIRGAMMPIHRAFPLKNLIEVCKEYTQETKRMITFEYVLIKGVNAAEKDALELVKLIKGMLCKVNLIPYNSIKEFPHEAPTYGEIVAFQRTLQRGGIKTTVRFSKGQDIEAACGQLRSLKTGAGEKRK